MSLRSLDLKVIDQSGRLGCGMANNVLLFSLNRRTIHLIKFNRTQAKNKQINNEFKRKTSLQNAST